jgi:hypothetical protein
LLPRSSQRSAVSNLNCIEVWLFFSKWEIVVTTKRKTEAKASKTGSAKIASKRSYKAPAIRKDQKLAKVTGFPKISGPT